MFTKVGKDEIIRIIIVSVHAGEMISEVAVAMAAGMGLGKLSGVYDLPYPCGSHKTLRKRLQQDPADTHGCKTHREVDVMAEKLKSGHHWVTGSIKTPAGNVPQVNTSLSLADKAGAWKVRWAIGRSSFAVDPGLYAVGNPTAKSHVLVSCNYKMSFDRLRASLSGLNCWILVINTFGINVWCAAGKGTFATPSIAEQMEATQLTQIVSHRRLILPQLAAAGVSAQKVAKQTGFRVTYGPVRAESIKEFLAGNMKATEAMRTVNFAFMDRLVLTPVELVVSFKYIFIASAVTALLAGFSRSGYSLERAMQSAPALILIMLSAWIGGAFIGPTLLPVLPGKAFAAKGALAGFLAYGLLAMTGAMSCLTPTAYLSMAFMAVAIASFLTMNFTGCSTYTSPSGVLKEMKIAIPLQAALLLIGALSWIASLFLEAA